MEMPSPEKNIHFETAKGALIGEEIHSRRTGASLPEIRAVNLKYIVVGNSIP